ncbi:MAG: ferrous iron transport protein A [Treponema sp.]|jgi:ferrous iron transport protein A|nr:ferrous iron transport protein A [Treponema sp.]
MLLSDAPKGASFKVVKVMLRREVGKRLADMGFTENTEGAVVRSGFFRGPLQVRIRGYDILIRRCEAAGIEVEPVGNWPVPARGLFAGGYGNPLIRWFRKQTVLGQNNEQSVRVPGD